MVLDDHVLMALPELYRYGRERRWFSNKLFAIFMFDGIVQVSRLTHYTCEVLTVCRVIVRRGVLPRSVHVQHDLWPLGRD